MPIYVPTKLGSYYIYAAAKNDQWGGTSYPLQVGMIQASCDGGERYELLFPRMSNSLGTD